MKHLNLVLAILCMSVLVTSCKKEINGSGHFVTQTRTTSQFDEVASSGDFTVILVQDSVSRIELYGEDNILPEIETAVHGNELRVYFDDFKNCYDHSGVTITIYNPAFNGIHLSGTGKILSYDPLISGNMDVNLSGSGKMDLNVNSNFLTSRISGSGAITLQGTADHAAHTISGSGNINAYTLLSSETSATISGSGNCRVYVSDKLNVTISGSGSVYYIGHPQITSRISGSGQIKPE